MVQKNDMSSKHRSEYTRELIKHFVASYLLFKIELALKFAMEEEKMVKKVRYAVVGLGHIAQTGTEAHS